MCLCHSERRFFTYLLFLKFRLLYLGGHRFEIASDIEYKLQTNTQVTLSQFGFCFPDSFQ